MRKKLEMLIKKIPDASGLVTKTAALKTKISEVENKTPDTNLEFNKLTAKIFAARLKQVDLVNKTDFDQITSNKTKSLEFQKKLNSLIIKNYIFS